MILSLRIVALLMLLRLFVMDVEAARGWWDYVTVAFDLLLAAVIFYDREPPVPTKDPSMEEDVRR